MVSIVPSRFAGLKIEDDDDEEDVRPKKSNKNQNKNKSGQPVNQNGKQGNKQAKKPNQPKKKKANGVSEEQWQQWQERDKELVDNTYEKDLEHALLLSKLDFEAQKLEANKVDKNQESKKSKAGTKGKKQPMNLQQFNQMLDEKTQAQVKPSTPEQPKTNFFENINEQAKNIMRKEELQSIGQTQKTKIPADSIPDKKLPDSKSEVDVDSNQEMEQLRQENVKLRQELEALKEKCKKVGAILKNAELKEKVDLVLEIRNLKKTQEEMSNEMSKLYIELEQEKSRASHAMQHHSNTGTNENKGSRSAMRKSVRFDEQSFFENQ